MSSRRRFFYHIEGFIPPLGEETLRLGSCGFSAYLDRELAKRAFQKEIPENIPLQDIGRNIIRGYNLSADRNFKPYFFIPNEQEKTTCFVRTISISNFGACDLSADWRGVESLRKEDDEYTEHWLEYTSHNVDTPVQASALLSLFLAWANSTASFTGLSKIIQQ